MHTMINMIEKLDSMSMKELIIIEDTGNWDLHPKEFWISNDIMIVGLIANVCTTIYWLQYTQEINGKLVWKIVWLAPLPD